MSERIEIVADYIVVPDGASMDDWDNARYWSLHVRWRGPRTKTGRGGYAVTTHTEAHQLSRDGNWVWYPRSFEQRLYRWEAFDEAVAMARKHVGENVVNGHTWEQYLAWKATR